MFEALAATRSILEAWVFYWVLITGLGLLPTISFGPRVLIRARTFINVFWIGFGSLLAILESWHLIFAVDEYVFLLLFPLSISGWILLFRRRGFKSRLTASLFGLALSRKVTIGAFVVASGLIANACVGPHTCADTAGYHLNSIDWAHTFPVVRGLANLHVRLGFNESYFLYCALLESGAWNFQCSHLAGGLLYCVLMARIFLALRRLLLRIVSGHKRAGGDIADYFAACLIPPLVWFTVLAGTLQSPSPDNPVFFLGMVLAILLCDMISAVSSLRTRVLTYITVLLVSFAGASSKLAFLPPAFIFSFVSTIILYKRMPKRHFRESARKSKYLRIVIYFACFAAVGTGVWVLHGVILTGYIAYPGSVSLPLPVRWRMPIDTATKWRDIILAFARHPGKPPGEVLSGWNWFYDFWLDYQFEGLRFLMSFVRPFVLGIIFTIFAGVAWCFRTVNTTNKSLWLLVLGALGSITWWFLTVPDARFAGALFWIYCAAAAVTFFMTGSRGAMLLNNRRTAMVFTVTPLFIAIFWFPPPTATDNWGKAGIHFFVTDMKEYYTYPFPRQPDNSLTVNRWGVAIYPNGFSAYGPLASSQYFEPNLRSRFHSGKLEDGFYIDSSPGDCRIWTESWNAPSLETLPGAAYSEISKSVPDLMPHDLLFVSIIPAGGPLHESQDAYLIVTANGVPPFEDRLSGADVRRVIHAPEGLNSVTVTVRNWGKGRVPGITVTASIYRP